MLFILVLLGLIISSGQAVVAAQSQTLPHQAFIRSLSDNDMRDVAALWRNPLIKEHVAAFYFDKTMSWKDFCSNLIAVLEAHEYRTDLELSFVAWLRESQGCIESSCAHGGLLLRGFKFSFPDVLVAFLDERMRLGYTAEEYAVAQEAALQRAKEQQKAWEAFGRGFKFAAVISAAAAVAIVGGLFCCLASIQAARDKRQGY